jgi:hypothetical protein
MMTCTNVQVFTIGNLTERTSNLNRIGDKCLITQEIGQEIRHLTAACPSVTILGV